MRAVGVTTWGGGIPLLSSAGKSWTPGKSIGTEQLKNSLTEKPTEHAFAVAFARYSLFPIPYSLPCVFCPKNACQALETPKLEDQNPKAKQTRALTSQK